MKGLRPYSLGDQSRSRMHGTKVTLAGRPAFLPNHDVPIVVQQLTKGQIEAIPKDRFTVSMVSRPGNILFAPSEHGGGAHSDSLGHIVVDLHKKQARQMFASNYRFSNTAYMNDISFCCSSNSLGCGVRIHASRLFNIDLGYMHTFYKDRTVNTPTAVGVKTDVYNRHNDVIGVGLNFAW